MITISKFLLTMGYVFAASIFIFIVLFLYKKLFLKDREQFNETNAVQDLYTPKNLKEAINSFLDKTSNIKR